jgi:hypothetical protein
VRQSYRFRSSIIEELRGNQRENSSIGLAFFFCDGNYTDKQNARCILGSLAKQLLHEFCVIPGNAHLEYLKRLRMDFRQSSATPLLDSLVFILEWAANLYHMVYIIVDGLDECSDRRPLVDSLLKLTTKKINLLITSRPEKDIEKAFHERSSVGVGIDCVREDIATHVNWKLQHDESFERFGVKLKSEIREKLTNSHGGMYLFTSIDL